MDNCIFNDEDNSTIGFYKDLQSGLKKQAEEFLAEDNWEEAREITDTLVDLLAWADNKNLLVLSDNNGMGYTIDEYKKGE